MKKSLLKIEGLGKVNSQKLKKCGVTHQASLLKSCSTRSGRKNLAKESGISESKILKFVNRADLARIKGIGEEWSDLLEHSGVDTVKELAMRNAENLFEKMIKINKKKKLVRMAPSEKHLRKWIGQAKRMKRAVNY